MNAERIEIRCFSLYDIIKSSDIFFTHSSICYTGFTRDNENKKILCLHNSEPTSKEKGKRAKIFVEHSGLDKKKKKNCHPGSNKIHSNYYSNQQFRTVKENYNKKL